MSNHIEFQELSDEQLTMVAGGDQGQGNNNSTGQGAGADASATQVNVLLNAANLAAGNLAVAAPLNVTLQRNVAIGSIVVA